MWLSLLFPQHNTPGQQGNNKLSITISMVYWTKRKVTPYSIILGSPWGCAIVYIIVYLYVYGLVYAFEKHLKFGIVKRILYVW